MEIIMKKLQNTILILIFFTTQNFIDAQPKSLPLKNATVDSIDVIFGIPGSNGARVKPHSGIDFIVHEGTPVFATEDGIVNNTKVGKGHYGTFVKIKHDDTYESFYAHLQKTTVVLNQKVKKGDLIGSVGKTGLTNGPTLHYEIRKDEKPVDPVKFIK